MADQQQQPKRRVNPYAAGGLIGLALAIAIPALKMDEGKRNVGYLDIAQIPTVCFGHTGADVRAGVRLSDAQCDTLLAQDARAHLDGVLRCTPNLIDRPYPLAAATRLTFNIGVANYCRSTVARRFRAGDIRGGCEAFMAWNRARVNGRSVEVRGLTARRARERAECLVGAAA